MNEKLDELARSLAQSVTRRSALKNLSVGLAGMALACLGLANKAEAARCKPPGANCMHNSQCCSGGCFFNPLQGKNPSGQGVCL